MDWNQKVTLVRSLKGSAVHCLLALLVANRPLTFDELRLATGYSKPSLASGLAMLELTQLAARERESWALLATSYTLFGHHDPPDPNDENAVAKNFFSLLSSSITQSDEIKVEKKKEEEPESKEIFALLASAGIGPCSRKMRELVNAGLSVDFVRGHVQYRAAALKRGEDYPTGWLITKLLDGDPVPAVKVCRCGHCETCKERLYAKHPHIKR